MGYEYRRPCRVVMSICSESRILATTIVLCTFSSGLAGKVIQFIDDIFSAPSFFFFCAFSVFFFSSCSHHFLIIFLMTMKTCSPVLSVNLKCVVLLVAKKMEKDGFRSVRLIRPIKDHAG